MADFIAYWVRGAEKATIVPADALHATARRGATGNHLWHAVSGPTVDRVATRVNGVFSRASRPTSPASRSAGMQARA